MDERPLLGIFDSGVGGFSVFREVRKNTTADIIYFGDCARAPYGNRSEHEIVNFIKEILLSLQTKKVTHFVSACNSMSVLTTEQLLTEVGIPKEKYIDMTQAVDAIHFPADSKVIIVGTRATITSQVYQMILHNKNIIFEVFTPATLAGNIENGNREMVEKDIDEVLHFAKRVQGTHVLYACTHYPLAHDLFTERASILGWDGGFVDPSEYIAIQVKAWKLEGGKHSLFTTSLETEVFRNYKEKMW